jgi:hypothetical protein
MRGLSCWASFFPQASQAAVGHQDPTKDGPQGPSPPGSDPIYCEQDQMAEKVKKGEMTMLMPVYTAQWVAKVAMRDRQQAETEYTRLARLLCSARKARQPKQRSWPEMSTLKKLMNALGYT